MDNTESVAHKTARTSLWSGIEKMGSLGIQFVISMLLARLLSPSDYGMIAMLMVFIAILDQIASCGFSNALIRKIKCESVDYSTAFYFNIIVSLICYAVLYIIAPYVAFFYNKELLCPVLRAIGLCVPINALTLVQSAILQRNLEAKKNAAIVMACSIISGVVAIYFAYQGLGVWTLVLLQLLGGLLKIVFLWYRTIWYPKLEYSIESMRYLWNFGSKMLLTGIISVTYANIYSIVIGKFYDAKSLGLFNRGQHVAILLPNILEGIFVRNSLPIMSQLQDDEKRMTHVYNEFIALTCFLNFPIVFLTVALAEPFVSFVLSDKWLGCVIYIQIFSFNSLLSPTNSVNLNLLQAYGRSDFTLKAEVIKKSLGFILVFLLLPYGPLVLAIGSSSFCIVAYSVNLYYARKLSGMAYWNQIKTMVPILLSCFVMIVAVYIVMFFIESDILKLISGVIVGMIVYMLMTIFVLKLPIAQKIIKIRDIL